MATAWVAPAALGAEAGEIVKNGVSYGTSTAPPIRIQTATPIKDHQGAISRNEPNQCDGLTAPHLQPFGGARAGNGGLAVSPGDIELVNLQPDTDYTACISILNFATTGKPVTGRLDDVDIVAGTTPAGGINVLDRSQGVGTWVIPSTREFSVPANSRLIIPYIVHTPAILPAGTVVGGVAARFTANTPVAAAITQRVYVSSGGGQHRKLELTNFETSRLLGRSGHKTFHARFNVRNRSDYVETFEADLSMSGLGRTVRRAKATGGALLPDGRIRVTGFVEDMPWIGIFRPVLKVNTREGTITRKLPWVLVLPPWPYVVALVLAALTPLFFLWRWHRQNQDWRQYLEEDEDEAYEEDYGEDDVLERY